VRREWVIAPLGWTLLAVVMTWPAVRHPGTTIPKDIYDPSLHALPTVFR
jgi:hypothetical protein